MILGSHLMWRRLSGILVSAFIGGLAFYTIIPLLPLPNQSARPRTIIIYGFSILEQVMTGSIFPAFQAKWRERTGEHVEFISSFGGSGTVTNQVIMGVPAEVVLLSLELDAQRLVAAGVTGPDSWKTLPEQGVLNRSPIVILVRQGNPKGIRDWADLARTGVRIIHPDPLTSGAANWSILAEYGAGSRGGTDQNGKDLLVGIWRNVVALAGSARAARSQFENGFGDALVTYEQDVIVDKARGQLGGEIVYPQRTIFTEHTVVLVDRNIKPDERELINAFLDYLWSKEAQSIFVGYGFRSTSAEYNANNSSFGVIEDPFSVRELGGWTRVKKEIIDGVWKSQVMQELKR